MTKSYFITGTDTDAGKTVVTAGLLAAANAAGLSSLGIKPVAAGCEQSELGLRNEDALALMAAASLELPYEEINPIALEPAIAPHIAAQELGQRVELDFLAQHCRRLQGLAAGLTLVEGAGGWRVPLNETQYFSDLPKLLEIPVVLVVGMKLGCLSHALLTQEAIKADGLKLAGWVANCAVTGMARYQENLQTLKEQMQAPLLGVVPHLDQPVPEAVAEFLDITALL